MNSERPSNSLTILARTGRPWMNAWRISPGCRLRDMRCSWCSQRLYWPTTMATAWTYYGQSLFASLNIGRLRFPGASGGTGQPSHFMLFCNLSRMPMHRQCVAGGSRMTTYCRILVDPPSDSQRLAEIVGDSRDPSESCLYGARRSNGLRRYAVRRSASRRSGASASLARARIMRAVRGTALRALPRRSLWDRLVVDLLFSVGSSFVYLHSDRPPPSRQVPPAALCNRVPRHIAPERRF